MRGLPESGSWRRLIGERDATRFGPLIRSEIERLAAAPPDLPDDPSYATGLSGLALTYGQLAQVTGERRWLERARTALAAALDAQSRMETSRLGFFSGLTGVGWTVHRLAPLLEIDAPAAITADLDAALVEALGAGAWRWEIDLVSGIVGIGCYLLDHPDRSLANAQIGVVVDRLEELALWDDDGVRWLTKPAFLTADQAAAYPAGRFDLGLAHGAAGLIALLARICHRGPGGAREVALLRPAVSWLLANRRQATTGSSFSRFARPAALMSCRSAWCYGDPGIAVALLAAARALGDSTLWSETVNIARRSAARPLAETEVSDACLCHGSGGLGHIFNCLYQATGEHGLELAARFWLDETASYLESAMDQDLCLLQGRAGAFLALLAAVGDHEPLWSRPLLVGW